MVESGHGAAVQHSFQDAFDAALGADFQHSRACWLGQCAELVYPATDEEKQADEAAKRFKAAQKELSPPWWKRWRRKSRSADFERARSEAIQAVQRVAQTEGERIEQQVRGWGFSRFQFMSGISTQCYVAANERMILICFRGTESNRPWDIYDDLVALPTQTAQVRGNVHLMFWTALKQVWRDTDTPPLAWPIQDNDDTTGLIDYLREFRDNKQPVWITGHSLGGALATMASARLVGEGVLDPDDIAGVYTFGQPRVGDETFAGAYKLSERHFRVVNDNDIVTRVPPESLHRAEKIVRMYLPGDGGDDELSLSKFQYRHVGRVAFIDGAGFLETDIGKWEMLVARIFSRLRAPFRSGSFLDRFLPGLPNHSMVQYNEGLAKKDAAVPLRFAAKRALEKLFGVSPSHATMSQPTGNSQVKTMSDAPTPPTQGGAGLAIFSGGSIGLLVGVLMGFAVSPTVGVVVGSLASSLALILGLNDKYFSQNKAIRIGTFGIVCVITVLASMYARTHSLMAPSMESQLEEYMALGYSKPEALDFIKLTRFGIANPDWVMIKKPAGEKGDGKQSPSGAALTQMATTGVLFGAEIDGNACSLLREKQGDNLVDQFYVLDGIYKQLATRIENDLGQSTDASRTTLAGIRDSICGPTGSPPVKFQNCQTLTGLENQTADQILAAFKNAGPAWHRVGQSIWRDVAPEYQRSVLLSVRETLCVEKR